jgi:hypothetical protein
MPPKTLKRSPRKSPTQRKKLSSLKKRSFQKSKIVSNNEFLELCYDNAFTMAQLYRMKINQCKNLVTFTQSLDLESLRSVFDPASISKDKIIKVCKLEKSDDGCRVSMLWPGDNEPLETDMFEEVPFGRKTALASTSNLYIEVDKFRRLPRFRNNYSM